MIFMLFESQYATSC